MKEYDNSIQGLCEWACAEAELDFDQLRPEDVELVLADGQKVGLEQADPVRGKDVRVVVIKHPDAPQPIRIEVTPPKVN